MIEQNKNISGSFSFEDGKLNFICNTTGVSFTEVKVAITALRDECNRQIKEQSKCPYYDVDPNDPLIDEYIDLKHRLSVATTLLHQIEDSVKIHSSRYPGLSMRVFYFTQQNPIEVDTSDK